MSGEEQHQVHNDEDTSGSLSSPQGCMVFSPTLIQTLNQDPRYRLPTTYAGVRRVRPSSRQVHQVLTEQKKKNSGKKTKPVVPKPQVCFKVVDPVTGKERRMTKEEKRQAKLERRRLHEKQKQEAAAAAEQEQQQEEEEDATETNAMVDDDDVDLIDNDATNSSRNSNNGSRNDDMIVQLKINPLALEQELADLQGERNGSVPPALLSPSQSFAAWEKLKEQKEQQSTLRVAMDETWSQRWADALQRSMLPATATRKKEAMRDMPYEVVPQAWQRMRPKDTRVVNHCRDTSTTTGTATEEGEAAANTTIISEVETNHAAQADETKVEAGKQQQDRNDDVAKETKETAFLKPMGESTAAQSSSSSNKSQSLALVTKADLQAHSLQFKIRPFKTSVDCHLDYVVQFLNASCGQDLYLSCGAKFGCDLLLYDGPRSERHAFAGLRVVVASSSSAVASASSRGSSCDKKNLGTSSQFPLPRAYDLAGYVRCLNTAGKLALLATVVPPSDLGGGHVPRVAILDLLLKRIRVDPSSFKKRKRAPKTLEHRLQTLKKK